MDDPMVGVTHMSPARPGVKRQVDRLDPFTLGFPEQRAYWERQDARGRCFAFYCPDLEAVDAEFFTPKGVVRFVNSATGWEYTLPGHGEMFNAHYGGRFETACRAVEEATLELWEAERVRRVLERMKEDDDA